MTITNPCTKADCDAFDGAPHDHIPMYDPPGTTRLDIIRERLALLNPIEEICPIHNKPYIVPDCDDGFRRCTFYIPELGASEDYGCPQGFDHG